MAVSFNDLDQTEIAFLKEHRIHIADIYDGRKQCTSAWKVSAKEGNYPFILTQRRTCSGNHRLKTRSGHCPQCNSANIAFIRRESATGYVYIASAHRGKIVKIGYAKDINVREATLREQGYGGYHDWKIICFFRTHDAGKMERRVSARFADRRAYGNYFKDGKWQTATEMFRYNQSSALEFFMAFAVNELGLKAVQR